jgi:phage N-6-adenine-methyltransferase
MTAVPISTVSRQDYCVPEWLRKILMRRWRFTRDAAASAITTLCRNWYGPGSKHEDALSIRWSGKRIFCNPPYENRRGGIGAWLARGLYAVRAGRVDLVVFLLPANTGTYWFRIYAPHCRTIFLSPRVAFADPNGIVRKAPPHASMLMIMDGAEMPEREAETPIRSSVWYLEKPARGTEG